MSKCKFSCRYLLLAVLVCSMLLLSACAGIGKKEESIEKRATERWETILSGDYLAAYDYLSPGFRSSVSSNQYQRSLLLQKIKWTGASYGESDCAETTCKVKISIDFTVYGALPGVRSFDGTQQIEESWVKVDGNWYYVPKK